MLGLRVLVCLLEAAQGRVNTVVMRADRKRCTRIVARGSGGLGEIHLALRNDDLRIRDLMIDGAQRPGFGTLAKYCSALIHEVLHPGARGELRDEIESVP